MLEELGLSTRPRLIVYNKADLLQNGAERLTVGKRDTYVVSAMQKDSTYKLARAISSKLGQVVSEDRIEKQVDDFVIDGVVIAPSRASLTY